MLKSLTERFTYQWTDKEYNGSKGNKDNLKTWVYM